MRRRHPHRPARHARPRSVAAPTAATLLVAAGAAASWGVLAATPTIDAGHRAATATGNTSAYPSTAPRPSASTARAPDTITLAFAGDVHFEDQVRRLLTTPDALAPLRSTLGAADFAMVNLETAITAGGTPVAKKFTFSAPASALTTLKSAGIDAVSMANNHAADYGRKGLTDTLRARSSGTLPIVGVGRNAADAFTPAIVTVRGVKVALLASLQLWEETSRSYSATTNTPGVATNLDMARLRAAVRAAAARADVVVVFMHWGTDYSDCADSWQKRTVRALEQDGADVIVGGHAHRLQGSGWSGRSYVAYGLGNFVWWKSAEPDAQTGVLTLTVDAAAARARGAAHGSARRTASPLVTAAKWTPMLVGDDGIPRPPADPVDADRLQAVWDKAVTCSGLTRTPPDQPQADKSN